MEYADFHFAKLNFRSTYNYGGIKFARIVFYYYFGMRRSNMLSDSL